MIPDAFAGHIDRLPVEAITVKPLSHPASRRCASTAQDSCRPPLKIIVVVHPTQGYGNALGFVAAAFDYRDQGASKGLWVGFFSAIGRQLAVRAGQIDAFAIQAREEAAMAALKAQSHEAEVLA